MTATRVFHATLTAGALACLLCACGGGGDDGRVPVGTAAEATPRAGAAEVHAAAPTPSPTSRPAPRPAVAPAPGVLVYESFGFGPNQARTAGETGELKPVRQGSPLGGLWVEWPGNQATRWIGADAAQAWRLCSGSSDAEGWASPMEAAPGSAGAACSSWAEPAVQPNPTALLPFNAPATAWFWSVEATPARPPAAGALTPGAYVAFGLTQSVATAGNLQAAGQVWLSLRYRTADPASSPIAYELRMNGRAGPMLATGTVPSAGSGAGHRLAMAYDPAAKVLSADVDGVSLGRFPIPLAAPKYLAIEGAGRIDNLTVHQ